MNFSQLCISIIITVGFTFAIWFWTRKINIRRFNQVFPKTYNHHWDVSDYAFLRYVERCYHLKQNAALRIPPTTTAIDLYLTLYPEHCIYDANENQAFLRAFYPQGKEVPLYHELLTYPFQKLAQQWNTLNRNEV